MLDQKDHLLLKLLQDNSRISASEAGKELELSVPAASERINSVLECHSVTGEGSQLMKIRVQNSSKLESLLKEIQGWPGVVRTHTWVVLSTFKESIKLNIEMKD